MKKKMKVITGKEEVLIDQPVRDLAEIITGKKSSKFSRYVDRDSYRKALYNMNHVELCEEIMRLGETASSEKEFCRNKCLAIYDRAQKPRKLSYPDATTSKLEDIINKGKNVS